jgi:hypothetical protein
MAQHDRAAGLARHLEMSVCPAMRSVDRELRHDFEVEFAETRVGCPP